MRRHDHRAFVVFDRELCTGRTLDAIAIQHLYHSIHQSYGLLFTSLLGYFSYGYQDGQSFSRCEHRATEEIPMPIVKSCGDR